ncbi:NAD-dependent epimerase/dehydratase [Dillenia turbinata]|uniref:NAD-dependent epimerase/dehydratase n=1 Tax=Dillenia turbinata TaxID=194707 RepID=A0AAN8UMT5_9MAGN
MARLVVLQHNQPSSSLLTSSLSDFNGIRLNYPVQIKRRVWQPKGALHITASSAKKILIMGGTRFIGVFLSRLLVKEGHQVTLFTRGKAPITQQLPGESDADYAEFSSKILHLKGDRRDFDFVKSSLAAEGFEVVYDINGREADEVEPILDALPKLEQFIYCSSAGVYLKSDILPHCETDAVDPKSRHKGKLETENLLQSRGVNWTSLRPVYIYGPLNYNPVEEWFFHRLKAGRPIPITSSGNQITQLGHVKDLATAFLLVLGNSKASQQVFNISGERYVTFDGLAKACAKHYFASIEKAKTLLGWKPEFGLVEGLKDSYDLDFGRGTFRKEADFSTDDMIILKDAPVLQTV